MTEPIGGLIPTVTQPLQIQLPQLPSMNSLSTPAPNRSLDDPAEEINQTPSTNSAVPFWLALDEQQLSEDSKKLRRIRHDRSRTPSRSPSRRPRLHRKHHHHRKHKHHKKHRHHKYSSSSDYSSSSSSYRQRYRHRRYHSPSSSSSSSPSSSFSSTSSTSSSSRRSSQSDHKTSKKTLAKTHTDPPPVQRTTKQQQDSESSSSTESEDELEPTEDAVVTPLDREIQKAMHATTTSQGTDSSTSSSQGLVMLNQMTDAELENFVNTPLERTPAARKKEAWVLSMYIPFCQRLHQSNPFPLDARIACAFLRFMALKCKYALTGIKNVMMYALLNAEKDRCGKNDAVVADRMLRTLNQLRHNKKVVQGGEGKEPLVYFDLQELITRIPNNLSVKAGDASLFLFSLHTGARAITCSNITYDDILYVQQHSVSKLTRVVINQKVSKGKPRWNMPVCIEGYVDREHPLDLVYWLQNYIKQETNLSLSELVIQNSLPTNPLKGKKLWHYTTDSMRECLKKRLIQAGFPPHKFSHHSLRSGYITSCLLVAGADPGRRAAVMELTSLVADWKTYGFSQKLYLKHIARRTIVSSRLIGAGAALYTPYMSMFSDPSQVPPLTMLGLGLGG